MRRSLWTIPLSLLGLALLAAPAGAGQKPKGPNPSTAIQAPGSPSASPADNEAFDATDCKSCHEASVTKMQQTGHGGLVQSCAACHDRAKAIQHSKDWADGKETPGPSVAKLTAAEVTGTCMGCHEKGDRTNFAGSSHDRKDVSCISCHSVHNYKSVRSQVKTVKDSETCYTCHQQIRAKMMRTSHHPVREGKLECASCHNPHDGSKPKFLKANWVNETCYSCHAE